MSNNEHLVSVFENGSDSLQVDNRNGDLHWKGKKIKTNGKLELQWPERFVGSLVALVTIVSLSISGYQSYREINTKTTNKPIDKTATYACEQITETKRECTIVYNKEKAGTP